jgi:hypothetical protein
MTGNNALAWLKVGGAIALAFVAYRMVKKTSEAVSAGGKAIDAATEEVKQIVTVDLNPMNRGNVINQAFEKMMGYGPGESLGGNIYDWLHPSKQSTPSSVENQGDVIVKNPSTVNGTPNLDGSKTSGGATGTAKPGANKPSKNSGKAIFDFGSFDTGRPPSLTEQW